MEELDEITIQMLPEPYKTWCDLGEKPYPWHIVGYRMVVRFFARKLERIFPEKYGERLVKMGGKTSRFYPSLSSRWYPYGEEFYTSDVPDEILFPAMQEAETDFISGQIDSAMMRKKYEEV